MNNKGLYYAKHCATHGDYPDRAQVCPKCVPERGFPSPASPAVGGEEEAEAAWRVAQNWQRQCDQAEEMARRWENSARKAGEALVLAVIERDSLRTTLEAVEKERDELRDGLKEFLDFVAAGATPLTLLASMQRARALLASRAEPPSGERGSGV